MFCCLYLYRTYGYVYFLGYRDSSGSLEARRSGGPRFSLTKKHWKMKDFIQELFININCIKYLKSTLIYFFRSFNSLTITFLVQTRDDYFWELRATVRHISVDYSLILADWMYNSGFTIHNLKMCNMLTGSPALPRDPSSPGRPWKKV